MYRIGKIAKPHGVKGEMAFAFTDDVFDRVDADYLLCRMDGILVPFFLEGYRFKSNSVALVKFDRIDTAELARAFTHVEVFAPLSWVEESADAMPAWSYFEGFRIFDERWGLLGEVVAVDDTTVNTLFVVNHHGNELLIPAQEQLIVALDHGQKTITMQLPEGLISL